MIDQEIFNEMGQLWSRLRHGGLNDPISLMRDAREFNDKLPAYYSKLTDIFNNVTAQGGHVRPDEAKSAARWLCRFCTGMLWVFRRFGFYGNEYYLIRACLGSAYFTLGLYDRAAYRFEQTMPILRGRMPPGHELYLALECVWARVQLWQGKDAEMLRYLDQVISRARSAGCTSRYLQHLETMRNSIYGHTGEHAHAQELFQNTLEGCIRQFGPESRQTVDAMCELAQTVELPQGNVARANELLSYCLYVLEANQGAPWFSPARMNVELLAARIEELAGRPENAITHLKMAQQEAHHSFPDRDPAIVETTLRLAHQLVESGQLYEALEHLRTLANDPQEADWLAPTERARFGMIYAACLLTSGGLSGFSSGWSTANHFKLSSFKDNYKYILQNLKEEIRRRRNWPSEDTQVRNSQEIWGLIGINILLLLIAEWQPSAEEIENAFGLVVEFKGRVAESMCVSREQRLKVLYPECRRQLEELVDLRKKLQEISAGSPRSSAVQELLNEKRRIEEYLADKIPELSWQPPTIADLASDLEDLHEDCALLEFLHIEIEPNLAASSFAVFILPSGQPEHLRLIALGSSEVIAKAIREFPADPAQQYLARLEALWDRVWKPVESILEDIRRALPGRKLRRLFISLDHCLNLLPFQAIRNPQWAPDRYLIDEYEISYLSTSRDIVNIPDLRARAGAQPLAIGLNKFDEDGPASSPQGMFGALRQSEDQAQGIGKLLQAEVWIGPEAVTKQKLLDFLNHVNSTQGKRHNYRSPAVVHFALHGFSLSTKTGEQPSQFEDAIQRADIEQALRHSGLALSGAASSVDALLSPEPVPPSLPGILNAYEISGLDLRDTQLVVLAACESGLGTLSSGEGVFGLQRSFFVAGAQSLIMALWPVDESMTAKLMEAFYTRLCRGESRSEALRYAQLRVRERFRHPGFWAAFICQGNPLPIAQVVHQSALAGAESGT